MTVFFSKKQKTEFRKRKRRLKEATKNKGGDLSVDQDETEGADRESKASELTQNTEPNSNQNNIGHLVITVPSTLSAQEGKKFRKDARRKARAEGKDVSLLKFVMEGTKPENMATTSSNASPGTKKSNKKKRKREFPCLNDLVREEEISRQKREEEAARKQKEDLLSEEYKSRYLALDCEMVGIGTDGKKSALARVSIVDWDGKVVLDRFVQVPVHVSDFRTHVSGVTAKDIHKDAGAMKMTDCQETVAKLLRGKVLVGHALTNDLHALMLTHPKSDIRDTAKYRPFQRLGGSKWRPRKLRDLAKEHLDLSIQQEGQSHDSTDDARATMQLFRLVRDLWEKALEEKSSRKKSKTS